LKKGLRGRNDEEEVVSHYWMTFRKREEAGAS
jgi:hypothetical protein